MEMTHCIFKNCVFSIFQNMNISYLEMEETLEVKLESDDEKNTIY